jgi:hypothetical protein
MTSTDSSDTGTIQPRQNVAPSKVNLVIHHQFPGIELVSPVYACNGAKRHLSLKKRVAVGSTVQASFNIDPTQDESIGSLMYELRNTKQLNKDVMSSEDEVRCIRLFINWNVNHSKEFCVFSDIIEHDKGHIWNRDKLIELVEHYRLYDIQHAPVEVTYLMYDNRVLMTKVNVVYEEECYKLEMTISKTSIRDDTWRLCYFDMDR